MILVKSGFGNPEPGYAETRAVEDEPLIAGT